MNTGYPSLPFSGGFNELAVLSALKKNLSAVKCPPIPFEVVIPVITPVYPSTFSIVLILSVRFCGCCVITCGGLVNVYPKPIFSIETDDIDPLVIIALANAVVPTPTPTDCGAAKLI